MKCSICGQRPRSFWLYGGAKWWNWVEGEPLCPGCWLWAIRLGLKVEVAP